MFVKKKQTPAPVALAPLEPRPAAPVAQPQPAPARPKPASLFAQGLTVRGDILGDVEVHLDCAVVGDVKVGKLVVGPNARIQGSVVAHAVEVHGQVLGSITAQAVRLYASARVEGDITHEQLAMETGAEFEGRSQKFRRQTLQPAAQPQAPRPEPQVQASQVQATKPQPAPVVAAPAASHEPFSPTAH